MPAPQIVEADLTRPDHQAALISLTAAYASDPMGRGGPLPDDVLTRLVPGLAALPTSRVLLAYQDGQAVGLATCFVGFSTFQGRPLLNVHDLFVMSPFRSRGIGRLLLDAAVAKAAELGCGRVTLEVSEKNERARSVYEGLGFAQMGLGTPGGGVLFYARVLTHNPGP